MARHSEADFEIVEFQEVDPIRGPVRMHVYRKDQYSYQRTNSYGLRVQLAFKISNLETGEVYKDRPEKQE